MRLSTDNCSCSWIITIGVSAPPGNGCKLASTNHIKNPWSSLASIDRDYPRMVCKISYRSEWYNNFTVGDILESNTIQTKDPTIRYRRRKPSRPPPHPTIRYRSSKALEYTNCRSSRTLEHQCKARSLKHQSYVAYVADQAGSLSTKSLCGLFSDQTPLGLWWKIARGEASSLARLRTQMESTSLPKVTSGETHDSLDAAGRLSVVNVSFNHPPYWA